MGARILLVDFNLNISRVEYEEAAKSLVETFAAVEGLVWKIWIMNEAENSAGGIYFFKDEKSLEAYLAGPLAQQVSSHPAFKNLSAKKFEVMEEVTAVTRGPI